MKKILLIASILILGLKSFSQESLANVDILIEDLLKKTQVAGISISVSKQGNLIYSKGFGFSDVKNKTEMAPTSRIRTASLAKVITATALGKLATDGKLDFDTPLKEYITFLKEPYASLTTRQIAGHTAGVQHRPASKKTKNKHFVEVKETLSFFEGTTLLFEPGTDYKYSSLGYNLLSILIEEVSGKRYTDFMKEDIFVPLGMTQTMPDNASVFTENDAKLYYLQGGKLKQEKKIEDGSYKLAGAGFRSTSVDMVKMMNAYSNGFISKEVVKDMFKSNRLLNGEVTNVGIGWRMNKDINNISTIEHAGNWQGARTVIIYYPDSELSISVMINTKCTLFIEESAQIIAQYFLNKDQKQEDIGTFSKTLKIINNRSGGSIENYTGKLEFIDTKKGALHIETDRSWLKQNNVYPLPSKNNFTLSTSYGLLYLRMNLNPKLEGELFQYQVLSDTYHMNQKPMLYIKEK